METLGASFDRSQHALERFNWQLEERRLLALYDKATAIA